MPPVPFPPEAPPALALSPPVPTPPVPSPPVPPPTPAGSSQTPFVHAEAPQLVPQAPQFAGSVLVSVHVPPQEVWPPVQVQTPALHELPGAHGMLQPPQLTTSVSVSTQLFSHWVSPAAQLSVQVPWEQTSPAPQTVPHVPQFWPSDWVLVQPLGQALRPSTQAQAPAVHSVPASQAKPQEPQCEGFVDVATQVPAQSSKPAAQAHSLPWHSPSPFG